MGGEDAEQRQQPHLEKHERASSAIAPPVEIVIYRPVQPCDPDQAEDDRELTDTLPRDVSGEMVCRLRDDHDVHEVVEQLEERDTPILDDITVSARRLPEVTTELKERC